VSPLEFLPRGPGARAGLKGPRAAEWLAGRGIVPPPQPNSWMEQCGQGAVDASLLVARLGTAEFFIEAGPAGAGAADAGAAVAAPDVRQLAAALQSPPAGVYPVLREDAAFVLSGDGTADVLAQVCNVNFAALELQAQPVIMTLLIGVAVLIVPQAADGGIRCRIWCDPTFGAYVEESVGRVVIDCGGSHGGRSV
jgi:sarcosine oxidase subunit gamma